MSLSMCITTAYNGEAPVCAVRKSLVTLPSGETTWCSLRVEVQRGPLRECLEMFRFLRGDGEHTPQSHHICTQDHAVKDDPSAVAMVAMCAWKNENVERNPTIWAFFKSHRVQWCEGTCVGLQYSWWDLIPWWSRWGLLWPSPSLIETKAAMTMALIDRAASSDEKS